MTAVLHVSRPVADALPAGLSIAPVEGRECLYCDGRGKTRVWTGDRAYDVDTCPKCDGRCVVPPVLSGRIAVAAPCPPAGTSERHGLAACTTCDGLGALIVGTATAKEVLPVRHRDTCQLSLTDEHVCLGWIAHPVVHVHDDGFDDLDEYADALGLRPGGWVVTIEDWAPTTERCPECGDGESDFEDSALICPTCDGDESCPPVPVAAAPVGTITTAT